jgi:HSP20 family molecular chaperone IbpA
MSASHLEGNVLTLSGERSFELPGDIDDKGIKAESKDGVLLVHIPRKQVPLRRSR